MSARYDIAILADPRFPGGTSTAVASEIEAAAASGYRVALISAKGAVLKAPHLMHPAIAGALARGLADQVDPRAPVDAALLEIHHPQLLTHLPLEPLGVRAERRLMIVHHPPTDARGAPYYDLRRMVRHAAIAAGGPVQWAPIGPLVRAQLARQREVGDLPLFELDWHNVLDPAPWAAMRDEANAQARKRAADDPIRIGRHARPDPTKWPADRPTTLLAYPDDPRFEIRVLGAGPFLDELMEGEIPENWRIAPYDPDGAARFLAGLDLWVYHHHPDWVEGFGRTILEAIASGVPVFLPPHFESLFEDAALYVAPEATEEAALALMDDPTRRADQIARARQRLRERFSPDAHGARLRALIGPPHPGRPPSPARELIGSRRAMFVTSNGVGLGHLTRAMAIARRLPDAIEPVFVTMSQAAQVVRDQGYVAEFVPFHGYLGVDHRRWNHFLRLEMEEFLGAYRPFAVLFDGNVPYGGLTSALKSRPEIWRLWIRRGMWRKRSGQKALAVEPVFDWVIEPEDLADSIDEGPTRDHRARTRAVGPIRFGRSRDLLGRNQARRALDLPEEGPAFLVQLGSGNNFDFARALAQIADAAAERPASHFVVIESPIADRSEDPPSPLLRRFRYPLAPVMPAFDGAISAVGYNAFHELLLGSVPTLFLANENPMMDDQRARSLHAERAGLALAARADDPYDLEEKLRRLMDAPTRETLKARMRRLDAADGAREAARILEDLALTSRADIPIATG